MFFLLLAAARHLWIAAALVVPEVLNAHRPVAGAAGWAQVSQGVSAPKLHRHYVGAVPVVLIDDTVAADALALHLVAKGCLPNGVPDLGWRPLAHGHCRCGNAQAVNFPHRALEHVKPVLVLKAPALPHLALLGVHALRAEPGHVAANDVLALCRRLEQVGKAAKPERGREARPRRQGIHEGEVAPNGRGEGRLLLGRGVKERAAVLNKLVELRVLAHVGRLQSLSRVRLLDEVGTQQPVEPVVLGVDAAVICQQLLGLSLPAHVMADKLDQAHIHPVLPEVTAPHRSPRLELSEKPAALVERKGVPDLANRKHEPVEVALLLWGEVVDALLAVLRRPLLRLGSPLVEEVRHLLVCANVVDADKLLLLAKGHPARVVEVQQAEDAVLPINALCLVGGQRALVALAKDVKVDGRDQAAGHDAHDEVAHCRKGPADVALVGRAELHAVAQRIKQSAQCSRLCHRLAGHKLGKRAGRHRDSV